MVSLFASSVRPHLYGDFFNSLTNSSCDIEVCFAGNLKGCGDMDECEICKLEAEYPLRYKATSNIKPAQCYEIARRDCTGEVVVWVCDDAEFKNDILGKAYEYWKSQEDEKLVLSLQTREDNKFCPMDLHSFFGGNVNTPKMAPLGMMSRKYLDKLGGLDRRYVCGQYENDIVMRVYEDGGRVEVFGDVKCCVSIDHIRKHGDQTPFWTGYPHDREILENSWVVGGFQGLPKGIIKNRVIPGHRLDAFEPFEDKDLLTVSQSYKGGWE